MRFTESPEPIEVLTEAVRQHAGALTATAHRIAAAPAELPDLVIAAPGAAAEALAELALAVRAELARLGAQTVQFAAALETVAEAYRAADERAANRLRRTPG